MERSSSAKATTLLSGGNGIKLFGYKYVSGTVNATAATVIFSVAVINITIYPGPTQFGAVTISQAGSSASVTINSGETMTVKGLLTFSAVTGGTRIWNGNIDAYGDVTASGTGAIGTGTGVINFKGSSSATFSKTITLPNGTITVAKTGGAAVSLGTATTLASGQALSVSSGSVSMNGYALTIAGSLTLASGTSISLGAGVLTVGGSAVAAGPYGGGNVTT